MSSTQTSSGTRDEDNSGGGHGCKGEYKSVVNQVSRTIWINDSRSLQVVIHGWLDSWKGSFVSLQISFLSSTMRGC
jgi:hypothetical protein